MTEGFYVFIAVAIFIISSFLYLLYFTIAKPQLSNVSNRIEVINEFFVLLIGYFAYILIDNSAPREQIIALGWLIQNTIYACIFLNILFLVGSIAN